MNKMKNIKSISIIRGETNVFGDQMYKVRLVYDNNFIYEDICPKEEILDIINEYID
jgi:hypothetical protein